MKKNVTNQVVMLNWLVNHQDTKTFDKYMYFQTQLVDYQIYNDLFHNDIIPNSPRLQFVSCPHHIIWLVDDVWGVRSTLPSSVTVGNWNNNWTELALFSSSHPQHSLR